MAYQPETDNDGVIKPGLYATPTRNLIENKGLLTGKGMLYAGTGTSKEFVCGVNEDKTDKKILVPVTTAINPSGASEGSVLIKKSTEDGGWIVDKIGNNNITNRAITGDKLAENFTYITSDTSSFCLQDSSNNSTPRLLFVESNNHASVALQADLKSQELEGKSYTLTLPNENGTVATKEQIESGEIVAKGARIAQYASEDTSKGTIEERLTSLGFRTGSLEILADNSGRKPSVDLNLIRKEGNVVTIYYSGEEGRASLDSSSLRQNIVGKIPSEFWPSTASIQRITELSSVASNLSLLKFNNEWYLQSSSTTANIDEIFAYNLKQESSIDEIQLEYLPEISVPEGVEKTVVTRSLANATDWDLIENIPYVLNANSNNVVVSYDKDTSQKHNAYSGTVPDSTYDTSAYTGSGFFLAGAGSPAGYYADLYVKWNKTNKTVTYILSKYNKIDGTILTPTKEGVATAKLSAFATNAKTLYLRGWHIFV